MKLEFRFLKWWNQWWKPLTSNLLKKMKRYVKVVLVINTVLCTHLSKPKRNWHRFSFESWVLLYMFLSHFLLSLFWVCLFLNLCPFYRSLWVSSAANPHENVTRPTRATWGFKRLVACAQCNRDPCESGGSFVFGFSYFARGRAKARCGGVISISLWHFYAPFITWFV